MSEEIILDRFEYKLPKDMYVVHKNSTGFKYKLKHSKKEFDSEDKCLAFIEKTLKERKRYLQLIKTLSVTELSKLFSDEVLLGLSPSQIKEYDTVEQFDYLVVIDEAWGYAEKFKTLEEVKCYVADQIGLNFHNSLDLHTKNELVVKAN